MPGRFSLLPTTRHPVHNTTMVPPRITSATSMVVFPFARV
jgi:hypothetical protein